MRPSPNDRFRELTSQYLDDLATPQEELELLDLLDDPARRQAFVALCRVDRDLRGLSAVPVPDHEMIARVMPQLETTGQAFPAKPDRAKESIEQSPLHRRVRRPILALSASVALLAVAGVCWSLIDAKSSDLIIATIVEVEGNATIRSDGGSCPLTSGGPLRMGREIATGGGKSRVVIEYPDRTRVELASDTLIARFVEAADNRSGPLKKSIHVLRGSVTVDAAKQPPGCPMTLITPEAEIAVLGTRFSLETVEDSTHVRVVEGSVRMLRRADQQTIDVPQGSYAVATPEIDRFVARPIAAHTTMPIMHLPASRGVFLEHFGGIAGLAFTRDGNRLVTGSLQGVPVRLWDSNCGEPSSFVDVPGHTAAVWSTDFSPDGKQFATGSVDQTVRLVNSGLRTTAAVLPQRSHVRAVAFSRDGNWLAIGGHDSFLRLCDPATGRERLACAENEHGGWSGVYSVAFSPDSKSIAIGLSDRRVRVRSVEGREVMMLTGHTGEVRSVAYSPDGRWLASASNSEVIVWDAITGSHIRTMVQAAPVIFSPDSRLLVVGGRNPGLVDVETGRTVALIDGHRGSVFSLAFQPGRNRLAIGNWRGVTLLDIPSFDDIRAASNLVPVAAGPVAAEQMLTSKLHHLRAGREREWTDFPPEAEGPNLKLRFHSGANPGEWTLRLRQQDVKQVWKVLLNGRELDRLRIDENDMTLYLPVPAGALVDGDNLLSVEASGKIADDIRVGDISLDGRPVAKVLSEAVVEIRVIDADGKGVPLPCRITVLNAGGSLSSLGAVGGGPVAVRPGVIYTASGEAKFGLAAGDYTIYAGRGFTYGIDSARISIKPGETARKVLSIRREVPTEGMTSCDTHVHTFTHSGHGDCTEDERMVTLAGEGIELPIATDHNCQIDYQAAALRLGVRDYFTPVIGNEVTTALGHFNVFPLPAKGPVPDWKLGDWKTIFAGIEQVKGARAIILNHPCDNHSGFRPFGPEHHLALTGENLDGWALRANALEIVNSGALQSDVMRPVRHWFGLLNRGQFLTPVGASDSHDVSCYIVGQGRTYISCKADRPGQIDVAEAVDNFLKGKVSVSCGLLTQIDVNGRYGPGDLAPPSDEVAVTVRVLGPSWVQADRVELYANGRKIKEEAIPMPQKAGVKWERTWKLPRFRHDVHLVAVASGPGVTELYWPIARPYQPMSPVVNRRVIGVTGAVWFDGDGDGKRTSAFDDARRLCEGSPKVADLLPALADYDEAVAEHVAGILQKRGISASDPAVLESAKKAGPHVERAFQNFAEAWRESQIARSEMKKP